MMSIVSANSCSTSPLSAKGDVIDIELNGETDDENVEDGETGFDDGSTQLRNIRGPAQPTESEDREDMAIQIMHGANSV